MMNLTKAKNVIVPLYKGLCTWDTEIDGKNPVSVSCGGNAKLDIYTIIITGDCTITIS